MSTYELAKEMGNSQPSAWLFHSKLQKAFASSGKHPLTEEVHIDEFVTGGKETGKPGRSLGKKENFAYDRNKAWKQNWTCVFKNHYQLQKENFVSDNIEATVSKDAHVLTDEYPSYDKLKESFPNAQQCKSDKGKNFLQVHQQIMNFKGWLRGTHHKCRDKHYQQYLDEYCFRTNRRIKSQYIFRNLMRRIVLNKSMTFKELAAYAA